MKIAAVALDTPMRTFPESWLARFDASKADVICLNEMPIGPWFPENKSFDQETLDHSIALHDTAFQSLLPLQQTFISSRPAIINQLVINEALVLHKDFWLTPHSKQYFPEESGYWETSWFQPGPTALQPFEINGLLFGVLLCTDAMFLQQALNYSRQGVQVICVPRATGGGCDDVWLGTLKIMAQHTGCYVISSNRKTPQDFDGQIYNGQVFNGRGVIFNPFGEMIAETTDDQPLVTASIDIEAIEQAKNTYPAYLSAPAK